MIEEADTRQCHDDPRWPGGDVGNAATALLGASKLQGVYERRIESPEITK